MANSLLNDGYATEIKGDKNGYIPSIVQEDTSVCFACGRSDRKLDRHECFCGAFRQKSKAYGLWVSLCHVPCHLGKDGYQYSASKAKGLRAYAQMKAMEAYGWTVDDFRRYFGKNYLHTTLEGSEYFNDAD